MASRILLVDDEEDFRDMIAVGLESEGYLVETAPDGQAALRAAAAAPPDLVIADINMPRLDGFALCQKLRDADPSMPIILLTSRDSEIDEALGLDLGADDYVTKPVSNRVLAARVRALLRRHEARGRQTEGEVLQQAALRLDLDRMEATVDGAAVELTVTEFRLLVCFVRQPGRVLTRETLLRAMRDDDSFVSDRMVDSYVNRLRRKLEEKRPGYDEIETVIGMGYRLRE